MAVVNGGKVENRKMELRSTPSLVHFNALNYHFLLPDKGQEVMAYRLSARHFRLHILSLPISFHAFRVNIHNRHGEVFVHFRQDVCALIPLHGCLGILAQSIRNN